MAILKYGPGGTTSVSTDGGKTWTSGSYGQGEGGKIVNTSTGQAVSQSVPTASGSASSGSTGTIAGTSNTGSTFTGTNSSGNTVSGTYGSGASQWTNAGTGATGKTYATSNNNQSIYVTRPDGTTSVVNPGDANYNATYNAMKTDLGSAGINYNPTYTTTVYRDVKENANGGYDIDYSKPQTFTTQAYMPGNEDLQKAMQDAAKTQPGISLNDYVKNIYNSGNSVADIDNQLNGVGLSDFNSQNAIYTAGGDVLAGGNASQYGNWSEGNENIMVNGSPQGGLYYTYGGQTYLMGGDAANLSQYVNGKTGNWTNADYILGNPQNNPYVQQDPALMQAVMQGQTAYGTGTNTMPQMQGTQAQPYNFNLNQSGTVNYTGNPNVDSAIGNINNVLNYAMQTGDSDLYNSIKQLLDSGLNTTQEWIAAQKQQAQDNAEKQARGARINQLLQQQAMNEAYSAMGIGTTGAVQSGMQSINDSYGRSLGDINSNLATLLGNLNEQELKALSDYYQNLGQYKYNITNDDLDRQYKLAQMAQQQQQFDANMAMQQQELAYKQYQDQLNRQWQEQMYNDSLEQSRLSAESDANKLAYDIAKDNQNYALKALQAGYTSPELAAALGISYDQALQLANQYANKNTYIRPVSSGGSSNPVGPDLGDYDINPIYAPGYEVSFNDLNNQYQSGILPLDQNGMPITISALNAGLYDPLRNR